MASYHACPECGATIATNSRDCWLCYRYLAASQGTPLGPPPTSRAGKIALAIFSGLMIIPAGFAACLVTCLVGPKERYDVPTGATMVLSIVLGLGTSVVATVIFAAMLAHIARSRR